MTTGQPWSRGHKDSGVCLSCGGKRTAKPRDTCVEPRHLAYYEQRRERNNAYRRERRAAARAQGQVYAKGRGRLANRARYQRERNEAMRTELFNRLGGARCNRCGFDDIRALAFDHQLGGGRAHRRSLAAGGGYFAALLRMPVEELRDVFQVLCANCNQIKRIENGEHHAPTPAT